MGLGLGPNDLVFGPNESIRDFDFDSKGRLYLLTSYSQAQCEWVQNHGVGARIRMVDDDGLVHTLVDAFARDSYG